MGLLGGNNPQIPIYVIVVPGELSKFTDYEQNGKY